MFASSRAFRTRFPFSQVHLGKGSRGDVIRSVAGAGLTVGRQSRYVRQRQGGGPEVCVVGAENTILVEKTSGEAPADEAADATPPSSEEEEDEGDIVSV